MMVRIKHEKTVLLKLMLPIQFIVTMKVPSNKLSFMKADDFFLLIGYNNFPPQSVPPSVHTSISTIVAIKADNTLLAKISLKATRKPTMSDIPTVCKTKHTVPMIVSKL